ncbi:RCC1 and BTB domain-containing protein 1 [Hondaea fermentalgiana]|uniref:RCC1 and BTB domain-containing protein 1 n=1 Tax=Hondaea fermentalgiana TaxID=2315210 RepID=A0A2R5GTP9_9STRA|nr:RCC1 and BTB domain-containing protein 1 [Hondaea fermentalgiana]|eukprot:GBG33699.1 RCC1 and BTB domain-containing protein 1 [Hondaea fermentalgiana]
MVGREEDLLRERHGGELGGGADSPSVRERVKTIERRVAEGSGPSLEMSSTKSKPKTKSGGQDPGLAGSDQEEEGHSESPGDVPREETETPPLREAEAGNNESEEDIESEDDEIELSRFHDAKTEDPHIPHISKRTASWFDPTEAQKRTSRDDPVPVRPSEEFLTEMRAVRAYLDAEINRRLTLRTPMLHHPEAVGVCRDAEEIAVLLAKAQCFRWSPGTSMIPSSPEETSEDTEMLLRFMSRAQTVKVGESAYVRAANLKTLTQAVMSELLACDASIQHEGGENVCEASALEAALRDTVRQTILAGELFVAEMRGHLDDGISLEADVQALLRVAQQQQQEKRKDGDDERPAMAWELAQRAGEMQLDVRTGSFNQLNTWGTGIILSGSAYVTVRDQANKKFDIKVTLSCENTLERIGAGLPFTSIIAAVAEEEETPETDEQDVHVSSADTAEESMFMRKSLPRLAVRDGTRYASQVDVLAWGRNVSSVLGIGTTEAKDFAAPMVVPMYSVIELARISKVSAALHHCVAMSDMGLVFTWGSGADGALGHGDAEDCPYPRMVSELCEKEDPVLVVDVASGGDLGGSHSACVSKDGQVFTWGLGGVLGHGDVTGRNVPAAIASESFGGELIDSLECGGGFTLALSCKGHVYSWGLWQHGRLGLGKPQRRESLRDRNAGPGAVQRYCLRPQRVDGSLEEANIVQIACGHAHAYALDGLGRLFSWGQGSQGQLGTGNLQNELFPVLIDTMLNDEAGQEPLPPLKQIASGANHAVAIARTKQVLAWGDLGSAALGMGEALTNPAVRVKGSANTASSGGPLATGAAPGAPGAMPVLREAPAWSKAQASKSARREQPWRWPREVLSLAGVKLRAVSAGAHHSTALSAAGEVFVWGQSPALRGAELISTPTLERDSLVRDAFVESMTCGRWHTVVATSGARCAADLYEWRLREETPHDVEICVGIARLRAHRAVIGSRSAVVRRMIELEESVGGDVEVIELEWSDMSLDAAAVVLDYMYGDNLFETLDPVGTLAEEVCRVAGELELERLEAICARSQAAAPEALEATTDKPEALRSRFALDLAVLVNEPRWSDMPESQNSLLRLASYLYTGRLIEGASNAEVLGDLTMAVTYGLPTMQHLCEDAVELDTNNAIHALRLSHELDCSFLRVRALHFVAKHLGSLAQTKSFLKLQRERTDITHDVLRIARASSQFRTIVSERGAISEEQDPSELLRLVLRTPEEIADEERKRDEAQKFDHTPLQWQAMAAATLCVFVYANLMRSPQMLQYVPFVNALGIAGVMAFLGSNLAK